MWPERGQRVVCVCVCVCAHVCVSVLEGGWGNEMQETIEALGIG